MRIFLEEQGESICDICSTNFPLENSCCEYCECNEFYVRGLDIFANEAIKKADFFYKKHGEKYVHYLEKILKEIKEDFYILDPFPCMSWERFLDKNFHAKEIVNIIKNLHKHNWKTQGF